MFKRHGGTESKSVKLKKPADLLDILLIVRELVEEKVESTEEVSNLIQIRTALEMFVIELLYYLRVKKNVHFQARKFFWDQQESADETL